MSSEAEENVAEENVAKENVAKEGSPEVTVASNEEEKLVEVAETSETKESESEKPAEDVKVESTSKASEKTDEKEFKMYVGNLPDECRGEKLKELFVKYGTVTQCDKVKNFAFVVSILLTVAATIPSQARF